LTERIRLTTAILIVPYRESAAILAKQAATLHHISGRRLVLGMAVGGRDDDYEPYGLSMSPKERWDRLMEMLDDDPPKVFLGARPMPSSSGPRGWPTAG